MVLGEVIVVFWRLVGHYYPTLVTGLGQLMCLSE